MNRRPRRSNLLPGFAVQVLLAVCLAGCEGARERPEEVDTLEVGDLPMEELQARCRQQDFGGTPADTTLETGATVRIMSHVAGPGTTLSQLANGRYVARVENMGNVAHPNWALPAGPGRQSCWHILSRGNRLEAEYVAADTAWVVRDTTLVIEFHAQPHGPEARARFVRKPPRDSVGQAAPSGLLRSRTGFAFLPAAWRTVLQVEEDEVWGWYTCVSNGCCRSMQ